MDSSDIKLASLFPQEFVVLQMRREPFRMYAIFVMLLLRLSLVFAKEIKISNELPESEQDLEISDSDKSYQYVAPPDLLTVTPVISQRILTDSTKKYDHGGIPNMYYLPFQPDSSYPVSLLLPQRSPKNVEIHTIVDANPLLAAAMLLSSILGIEPKSPGFNHPQHLPTNPYIALLLSHYGRYVPLYGRGRGIYGYAAANNYHNNKPFGAYKIYEDRDT